MIDLRLGDWRDVLADVGEVDSVITDPPYSQRTASGYRTNPDWSKEVGAQPGVAYGHVTEDTVAQAVHLLWPRVRKWFVVFGDHTSARWWEKHLGEAGAYTFAPLPWIKKDGCPRFVGDGPSSVTEWLIVARTKRVAAQGSPDRGCRRGWYLANRGDPIVTGSKDPSVMCTLVDDYSLPGDLILDPYAGGGTTLLAARTMRRRAIGAEIDPTTHAKARRRLARGYTPDMFSSGAVA